MMKQKLLDFCKREVVLVVATVLAVASAFVIPPSAEYMEYINWDVLGILLCLMIVMAGLQKNGLFDTLGEALLLRTRKVWQLVMVLVFLCFFLSMAITNDVALITFVPFTILALEKSGQQKLMIPVIVLQTIGANLGSMLTPIGNPQNLYLYNLSGRNIEEFMLVMLPYTVASFIMLLISIFFIKGKNKEVIIDDVTDVTLHKGSIGIYLALFLMAFLVVLKVLPFLPVLLVTLTVVFFLERSVLKEVDYCLLFTFISFFVFTGNMGNIPVVKNTLQQIVEGREVLAGILSSQLISNVPAALLLSGFTSDYDALLVGVNLGGLGTLIASMASLISYKLFANKYNDKKGHYFLWFTIANLVFLAGLMLLAVI